MGLILDGDLLSWSEIRPILPQLKVIIAEDFLKLLICSPTPTSKSSCGCIFGEEIEYSLIQFNRQKTDVSVSNNAPDIITSLQTNLSKNETSWHPEYATWMIEGVSRRPFPNLYSAMCGLYYNLKNRRRLLLKHLTKDQYPITIPVLPILGTEHFCPLEMNNTHSLSTQISDSYIHPNPRFSRLTANIRLRRGSKVEACVTSLNNTPLKLDCMAFGMGTCCTQLTLDATDLVESLHIFDHMAVLSPLMIAASAGSPIYQGKLVNTDTRWKALSDLVDDRSTNEVFTGIRSRYSSVYGYLGEGFENYQDVAYPVDESSYKYLIQQGVSDSLAKYAANIILKDPMIIEKDYHSRKVNLFQSHQSTVWQNVRWKACQQGDSSQYSYRVEFRPLEVQVGDMENACFIIFVVVYIKARLYAGRDTRISISKLDENMAVCHLQGAIKNQVYWWNHTGNESTQMAPSDIWNNDIYPMIQDYLSSPSFSQNEGVTQEEVLHMVQHVGSIFTGKTPTRAEKTRQWISARNPLVKDNSISNQVLTELLWNQTQEGILT